MTQRTTPQIYSAIAEISSELVEISSEPVSTIVEPLIISAFKIYTKSVSRTLFSASNGNMGEPPIFTFIKPFVNASLCSPLSLHFGCAQVRRRLGRANKKRVFSLLATRLALWLKPKLGGASDKQIKNGVFSLLATRLALTLPTL